MKFTKRYIELRIKAKKFAEENRLTSTQLELLLIMHSKKMGPMTEQDEIPQEYERRSMGLFCEFMDLSLSRISLSVKGLYSGRSEALINKSINPYNQCIISLSLTPEGVGLCERAETYLRGR